ncbi:putative leucine-rich repeat-containing protein DDB_G0290503 [Clytia hemisphaerica]|uniref:Uncharacterized protein n=1 Tax=Clytia hemisphaerica TaxID=252671 RepID=A0A7M5VC74_9CNID
MLEKYEKAKRKEMLAKEKRMEERKRKEEEAKQQQKEDEYLKKRTEERKKKKVWQQMEDFGQRLKNGWKKESAKEQLQRSLDLTEKELEQVYREKFLLNEELDDLRKKMSCQDKETKTFNTEKQELKSKLAQYEEIIKSKEIKVQELLVDQKCLQEEVTKLKTEDQKNVKDFTSKIRDQDIVIEELTTSKNKFDSQLKNSKNEFDSELKTFNEVIDKLKLEAECYIKKLANETIAKEDAEADRDQFQCSLKQAEAEKSQMEKTKDFEIKTLRKILAELQDEIFGLKQETNHLKEDKQILVDEKQTLQKACIELHKKQAVEMEILRRSRDEELGKLGSELAESLKVAKECQISIKFYEEMMNQKDDDISTLKQMLEKEAKERERLASNQVEDLLEQLKALETFSNSKPSSDTTDASSDTINLDGEQFDAFKEQGKEKSELVKNQKVVEKIQSENSQVADTVLDSDTKKSNSVIKKVVVIVDQPDDTDSGIHLKCKDSLPKKDLIEDASPTKTCEKLPDGEPDVGSKPKISDGKSTTAICLSTKEIGDYAKEEATGNDIPSACPPQPSKKHSKKDETLCAAVNDKPIKGRALTEVQETKHVPQTKCGSSDLEFGKSSTKDYKTTVVKNDFADKKIKSNDQSNVVAIQNEAQSKEVIQDNKTVDKASLDMSNSLENKLTNKKINLSDLIATQNEAKSDVAAKYNKTAAVPPKKSNLKKDRNKSQVKKKVHFEESDCRKILAQEEKNLEVDSTSTLLNQTKKNISNKKEATKSASVDKKKNEKIKKLPNNKGGLKARIDASLQIVDKALSGLGVKNVEVESTAGNIGELSGSSKANQPENKDLLSIEPATKHQTSESTISKISSVDTNEVSESVKYEVAAKNGETEKIGESKSETVEGSKVLLSTKCDSSNKTPKQPKMVTNVKVVPINEPAGKFEEVSKKLKNDVLLTVVDKAIGFSDSCQIELNLKDIDTKAHRSTESDSRGDIKSTFAADTHHFKPIGSLGTNGAFKPYSKQNPRTNEKLHSTYQQEIKDFCDFNKIENGFNQVQQFFNEAFADLGQFKQNSFYKLEKLNQNERILKSSAARLETAKKLKFASTSARGVDETDIRARSSSNHRVYSNNKRAPLESMLREIVPELLPRQIPSSTTRKFHNNKSTKIKRYNDYQPSLNIVDQKLPHSTKLTSPIGKTRCFFATEIQESNINARNNTALPSQAPPLRGNALNLRKTQSATTVQAPITSTMPANLIDELKERLAERSKVTL